MPSDKPNILFFHVDNLGMGELGCYGGGILRGADTKRTDKFASEGVKLTHYVVEPQCTPTRSALMTGRYPIRSGNHTIALGGNAGGIVRWEKTIAEILSAAGYATSCLGKWHIGAEDGRWPTDARGPQGRRYKTDPFPAAQYRNEEDLRPRISEARS